MIIKKEITGECRKGGNSKQLIVVHHTGSSPKTTMQNIINFFKKPDYISVHYVVGRTEADGIAQMVEEDNQAFHAGVSGWGELSDLNRHSIGIEVLSDGITFTEWQIQAATWLLKDIMARNGISPLKVLRHADIALPAGRKTDIGFNFFKKWGTWANYQMSLVVVSKIERLEKDYETQAKALNTELDKLNGIKKQLSKEKGILFVPLQIV